jgi:hypothetical protein
VGGEEPAQDGFRFEERAQTVIDEIVETAFPWGVFIGAGTLIGAAFPRESPRRPSRP